MTASVGNPILIRELRSRMRGQRAVWLELAYVAVLSAVVLTAYLASRDMAQGEQLGWLGRLLFNSLTVAQGTLLAVCAPAFAAAALTGEREQQTLEGLLVAPIRTGAILRGKMVAATLFLFLLLTLSVPLLAVCFLFGGISPNELLGTWVVQMANGLLLAAVGLGWSAVCRTTISATLMTYLTAAAYLIATGILSAEAGGSVLGGAMCPITVGLVAAELYRVGAVELPQWIPSAALVLLAAMWIFDVTLCHLRQTRDGRISLRPRLWLLVAALVGTSALVDVSPTGSTEQLRDLGGVLAWLGLGVGLLVALILCPEDADGVRPVRWWQVLRNHPASSVAFVVLLPLVAALLLSPLFWPGVGTAASAYGSVLATAGVASFCLLTAAALLRRLTAETGSRWATAVIGGLVLAIAYGVLAMATAAADGHDLSHPLEILAPLSPWTLIWQLMHAGTILPTDWPQLPVTLACCLGLQATVLACCAWPRNRRRT